MGVLNDILKPKKLSKTPTSVSKEPKYVEVDWSGKSKDSKEFIRVVTLKEFQDVEHVLDYLRDRNNILIIKVKPRLVQEKMELKRALKRIQRTTTAIGGDIAGVKEDIIVVTPPSVKIHRGASSEISKAGEASSPGSQSQ
ncbi:MAG: cell division protein SepF [Candidatus Undinarchaeales archaeon]